MRMRILALLITALSLTAVSVVSLSAGEPARHQPAVIRLVENDTPGKYVLREPAVVNTAPNCGWLPQLFCVKAPYDCKPVPCLPRGYDSCCDIYCGKPFPCPPAPSCGVGPCYCPKPPVCAFPGEPCRQPCCPPVK